MFMLVYYIRSAHKPDLKQIINLCEAHAKYEGSKCNLETNPNQLEKLLFDSPQINCLVVEKDRKLVGYTTFIKQVSTWHAGHYMYVDCLYLLKEFRGLGIGKKLMSEIKKQATQQDCFELQWQTPTSNKQGINFYLKLKAFPKEKVRFSLQL